MAMGDPYDDVDYGSPSRRVAPKLPTVWLRAMRDHTYHGRSIAEGDVYLAHEEEVENILNLKFSIRDTPPPTAQR